jgi:hypothetical protein
MKTVYVYIALVIGLFVLLVVLKNTADPVRRQVTTMYDDFAQCLSDAGARFYGAYWCPHCQNQKKLFDNSPKIPYIECSTPNGKGQLQVCADAGVTGYPSWVFADGSRLNGEVPLETLSEKTSCELPQAAQAT